MQSLQKLMLAEGIEERKEERSIKIRARCLNAPVEQPIRGTARHSGSGGIITCFLGLLTVF
jgi:hypothetical protein